jgi:NADH dehydrogenase [ubiquinone] 1 alpha subcomplex assembly factor 1
MPYLFTFIIICLLSLAGSHAETAKVLFDFADPTAMRGWQVEDDGVMGGVSRGNMVHDKAGHLIFRGEVSLENNGGFSSIQNNFSPIDVSKYQHAILRLKGDGKDYRFIVESDPRARHYYLAEFTTNGDWQEIKIPLRTMYPMRRGDRLDLPDYPAETLSQVRLMIANGRAESFELQVESIKLE